MNPVIENIMTRRSCRCFDPDRVPSDEVLQQIAEAGTWAPTGKGLQYPVIVVVTDKTLLNRIKRMNADILGKEGLDPFYGAPAMMIVLVKDWRNATYDGSTVMTTLMLAAHSLGVNSCWIHRAKQEFESEEGKEILKELGLEDDYIGVGHCALGYATKALPEPKERKADYIHWVK